MKKGSHKRLFSIVLAGLLLFVLGACRLVSENPEDKEKPEEGPVAEGCPGAVYPEWSTSPYVLPYPVGETYKIDLSNCSGSFHSEGQPDEFAIDFNMPIGSQITASRAGTVVYVEESGRDGGSPNNLVVVDHGDESYAQYMHLTQNGAQVTVGQQVSPGDNIGLSGATGLAGYPHLHFVVTHTPWRYPYASMPVTFRNTLSNERSLASGTRYKALPY
ncbi:MAG TPA: M23 family metallopeptidase [Calditrichia bacterium]|nr:M23 family metallopeptidase [Calditrichota bacterium]HQU72781.1 M23 family metallopeptidase [Calditrichia bacterium]HQV33537.1 M23 family metallopeptidase [Calditrichia bacterium]